MLAHAEKLNQFLECAVILLLLTNAFTLAVALAAILGSRSRALAPRRAS